MGDNKRYRLFSQQGDRDMTSRQIEHQIKSLMAKAESGEDWADICAMEAEMLRLREQESGANSQFGVGA